MHGRWAAIFAIFGMAFLGGLFSPKFSRAAGRFLDVVPTLAHGPARLHPKRVALSDLKDVKIDRSWAQGGLGPEPVASYGYLNRTPLPTHTTSAFNTTGATTLVAFVGSHPTWMSLTVTIRSLTDSVGNTWTLLAGPSEFDGEHFQLLGAVYYCNSPATSVKHKVTVSLSNSSPLVVQVYAVSGTDGTSTPLVSGITDPGVWNASTGIASTAISVPAHTLLLSWAKTESGAVATPGDGWYGDVSLTSHLTPAHKSNVAATSYASSFTLSSASAWQTAIVGLAPAR
jgi:hypothetical protein